MKVHISSDSVLCVGKIGVVQKFTKKQKLGQNRWCTNGFRRFFQEGLSSCRCSTTSHGDQETAKECESNAQPCSWAHNLWGRCGRRWRRYSPSLARWSGCRTQCAARNAEEGENGEKQIEEESERSELKEKRTCAWMTWRDSELEPRGACDPTSKSVTRCALAFMLRCCASCACRSSCCSYTFP